MSEIPRLIEPLSHVTGSERYNNPKVPEGGYAEDSQREILNEWFREASVFSNKSEEDREKMHAAYLKSNEGLILKGLGSAVARFTPEPLLNEANLAAIQQTAIHLHNNPDALIDMKLETANPQGGNEGLLPTEIAKVSEWSNPFHPLPDFLSQPNTEKGDGTESAKFRTQVWSARQNASAALASGGVPELPQHLNEIGIPDYSVPEDADEVTIARAKKRTAEFKEKYKDVFAKLDEYSNLKNKQNLSENWQSIKDEFEGSAFDIKLTKGTGDYTSVDIRFKGLDGKPVTVTSEKVQGFSPKILSDLIHGTIRGHEAMINDDTSFTLNPFADKKDLQPSTKSRIESLVGAGEEDWLKATGKGIERSVMGVLGSLIKGTSSFIMDEDDVRLKNEKGGSYLEHGAGFLDLMGEAGIASSKAHDAAMALAESRERELYGGTELERQFGLVGEKKNRYFGDIQQSFETAGTVAGELAAIFIAARWAKGLSALSRAPNAAKGFGTFGTEVAARAGSGAASKAVSVAGHTLNVASYPARALFGNSVAGYITATTSARSAATHAELADAFRKAGHEDYNERALAYTAIEVPALLAINLLSGKLITENSLAMPAIRNWMSKVFADNIQKQTLKGGIQRFITNAVAATPGDAATETAQGILSSMVQQAAREAVAPNSMMTEVMKGRGEIFDGVPVDLLAGIMSAGLFGQFNKAGRGENGISISDEHKKFIDGMKFKVLDEKGGGKAIQMPPMDKDQTGWIARFASPESANIYRESLIELDDITDALFNVDGKGNLTPKPEATKEEIGEYERLSNKLKSTTDFLYKSQMHETTDEGIYSGDTMEQVLLKARQLSDDLFSGEPKPLNERIDDMTGKLALEKADALNDWSAKRDEIVQSLTTDREIPAKNVKLPLDEAKADIAKRAKEIAHRMSQTEPGPEFAELAREYEKVSSEKVSRTVKGKSKPDAERIADKIISDMRSAETESHMNSSRKMAESLLQGEFGPTGETSPDFIGREMADKFKVVKAQVPSAYGGVKTKFELRLANAADAPAVKPLPNPPAVKSSDIGDGPRPKPSAIAQVDSEPEIPRAKIVRGKKPSAANPKPAPSTYFRGKTSPPQSTDLTPDTETAAPEPAEIGATPNNEGPRSTPSTYFRGKKSPPSPPESPVPSIKSPSPLKARARKRAEKTAKKAVDESQDLTARDIAAKELIDNGSTPEEANEIVDRILGSDDIVNKIVDSEAPERSSPKSFSERVNADIGKESAKNWTQEDFAAAEKYISTGDESALSGLTRIKKAVVLRNADEHRAQESSEDNIIRVDEKGIAEVVTADGKHAYKDTTIPPAQSTDTPKNDTQYSKNSASKGMSKDGVLEILGKLGVGPGGMVEVVNDPDANWDGLIRIENGKAVRIELNAAKLPTEADVNRVLNHEIAEAANADGALDFLVSKLTESERGEIIKTVEDLGYAEDQVTAEVAARAVEKLADAYRDRPWFSRMAAAVEQWASNLGLPMTRRAAERVAAKAISRVHPGTIRMEGRQSNPQFVRHSFAGEKAEDQPTEGKGLSVKDSGRGSQAGSTVLFSEIAEFAVQAARSGWSAAKYVAEAVKKFGEKFIEAIKRAFTATAREASDPDAFIAQPSEAPAPVAATRKTNGIVSKNPILSRLLNQSSAPQMSPNQKALTDSVSAEAARLSRIGLLNESKALGAIDRGFSNLFSELNRIHPSLRTMMVHMEKQGLVRKTGWEKESNDYYVKVKKLSPEKRREFTSLYRSGSLEFKNFLKKNGLEREVANLQGLLELIRNEAKRVGVDIGEIEDYLPTIVKPQDRFKLLAKLRGSEHWDAIQESIKKAESKKGRILDEDERAEVANKVLSQSSSRSKANPSNTKARKISTEDFIAEFAEHYMDPHDAIHAYISKMAEKITLNEFFGRDAQTSKMNSDYDGPIARGTSMGNLVMKLMDSGKISSNDVVKIQDIIQSRIEYRPDPPLLQTMKAGNVYLAMNAPIKALMQLVEIGRVAYEQGYWNTASSIGSGFKAAWNESTGSLQSMGISPGAQIGGPKDQLTLGTDIVWRSSLYRIFDGAAAAINSKAYAKRISKMSDAQLTEHISQFQEVWDRPVSEVMEELRKGDWSSPEASEMVFSELARLRPVVLSSMPRKWLKGGPLTRMAYNLKTFQIHQLDGLRNILFDEIKKSPNAKGVVKGIFNLSHVGFVLTMAGAGISQVKDWMMGRHTDWEDDVLDNFLKLILLSKYQMDSSDDPDTFKRNALNVINMPILDFINNAYNLQNKLRSKDTGETKDSGPKTPLDIFRESKVWPQLPTLGFGQWDYWRNTSVSPEKQVDWLKKSYADEMEPHTDRRRHLVEIGRDKRMARGLEDEKRSLEKLMTIKTKYEQQMLKEYKDGDHYAPRAWAEKIKRVAKDPSSWDSEYWKARAMR